MSLYLLDTNIVASLIRERGASPAFRIASEKRDDVFTSVIVASEIRFGLAKKYSARLQREAERVLDGLSILPFAPPADVAYGQIRAHLERRGSPIGANDMLIAAHCISFGAILVTNNTREFARVPDLVIEDWLSR